MERNAIVLAHEPPFRIGSLEVRPATCEIVGEDRSAVLEPRVMQVLVALHQQSGQVVGRDDLLQRCWAGRVVGEDAIHRVMSRLRHDAQETGEQFRVETITKVGYRLIENGGSHGADTRPKTDAKIGRRGVIAGAGALAVAGAGFGIQRWLNPPLPAEAREKLEEGRRLWKQGTMEGFAAAQAAFRASAAAAPDFAEPWGCLALSYVYQANVGHPSLAADAERGARAAITRALAIDPRQPEALASGVWLDYDKPQSDLASVGRRLENGVREFPRNDTFLQFCGYFLAQVGRTRDSIAMIDRWRAVQPDLPPIAAASFGYLLFNAGRTDEADQWMAELLERWPRHISVWFTTMKILMFSSRYDRALAMLDDVPRRPVGVPDWNFDLSRAQILALSRAGDRDEAVRQTMEAAHRGTGFAENAILFTSALGLTDEAFQIADGLFRRRGFQVGSRRFTSEQGQHDNRRLRTAVLFESTTAPLRADARFGELTNALGLEHYWKASGSKPDYRA